MNSEKYRQMFYRKNHILASVSSDGEVLVLNQPLAVNLALPAVFGNGCSDEKIVMIEHSTNAKQPNDKQGLTFQQFLLQLHHWQWKTPRVLCK